MSSLKFSGGFSHGTVIPEYLDPATVDRYRKIPAGSYASGLEFPLLSMLALVHRYDPAKGDIMAGLEGRITIEPHASKHNARRFRSPYYLAYVTRTNTSITRYRH